MTGVVLVLASILSVSPDPREAAGDLESRWRREYPRAAEGLEAIASDFVAKGSYSLLHFNGSTVHFKDLTVASSGDKKLFVREGRAYEPPKGKGIIRPEPSDVQCETPERAFILTRQPSLKQYLIYYVGLFKQNDESDFNYWYKNFARNATVYFGTSLLDRMRNPKFVLKSISATKQGEDELVRIEYTYTGKYSIEAGFVVLDPGMDWAIRKVEVQIKTVKNPDYTPNDLKVEVGYKRVDDGRFFPIRKESFFTTPKAPAHEHALLQIDQVTVGAVPDEIFRMSAYGLPDVPVRPAPRASIFTLRNPMLWLAVATSVACLALWRSLRSRDVRA